MKVLVVDDQPELLKAIGLMLEYLGASSVLVPGGKAALERLENETFDLVLCDIEMSCLRGPDLFREIQGKGLPVFPRFVFMSGSATREAISAEVGLESVDFLRKPFNYKSLKAALRLDGGGKA